MHTLFHVVIDKLDPFLIDINWLAPFTGGHNICYGVYQGHGGPGIG